MSTQRQVQSSPSGIYKVLSPYSIRVLRLQPASSLKELLIGTFEEVQLGGEVAFEALSYAWDGAFKNQPLPDGQISLEGRLAKIGGNLRDALRRLRHESEIRMIWADAVCINQEDFPERSAQVSMMAEVHSKATQVIMWVGEDSIERDGEVYIKHCWEAARISKSKWSRTWRATLLRTLAKPRRLEGFYCWPGEHHRVIEAYVGRNRLIKPVIKWNSSRQRTLIEKFNDRMYFSRRWCAQERALARKALLICGPNEIPFSVLEAILDYYPDSYWTYPANTLLRLRSRDSSVLDVLRACAGLECRDKRDSIYSIASLLRLQQDCPTINVDYALHWTTVYTRFARDLIMANGYFEAWRLVTVAAWQNAYGHWEGQGNEGRPSWVPDYSDNFLLFLAQTPTVRGSSAAVCSDTILELPLAYYGTIGAAREADQVNDPFVPYRNYRARSDDCLYGVDPAYENPETPFENECLILRPCTEGQFSCVAIAEFGIEYYPTLVAMHDVAIR